MNEATEWHDTVRRYFATRVEAEAAAKASRDLLKETTLTVLRRKLADGFELVGDVEFGELEICESKPPLRTETVRPGGVSVQITPGWYVQMRTSGLMRKVES